MGGFHSIWREGEESYWNWGGRGGGSSQEDTQEQVLFAIEISCQFENKSWPKLGLQAALPLKIPRGEKDEEELGNARTHARVLLRRLNRSWTLPPAHRLFLQLPYSRHSTPWMQWESGS